MGVGGQPAGSGRALRLDPFALPVALRGARRRRRRAGPRRSRLDRERVVLRRAVRGIRMDVGVPVARIPRRHACGRCRRKARSRPRSRSCSSIATPASRCRSSSRPRATTRSRNGTAWGRVLGLPLLVAEDDGSVARAVPPHRPRPHRLADAAPPPPQRHQATAAVDPAAAQARPTAGRAGRASRRARDHRAELSVTIVAGRSKRPPGRGVQHQRRKQDQAGVAVGLEHAQARIRIVDLDAARSARRDGPRTRRARARTRGRRRAVDAGEADQHHGGAVEHRQHRLGARPEQQRGRFRCRPARRPRDPDGRRSCRSRSPRRSIRHRAGTPAAPAVRRPRPSPSARPRRTRGPAQICGQ